MRDSPQMSTLQQSSMMNYPQPMYQSYNGGHQQQQQFEQSAPMSMEQHVQMSDVDFDAAFSEALAHAQEMDQERTPQIEAQLQPDAMDLGQLDQPESIRIGSDALNYVEKSDRTAEQDTRDADELARTAGQLLNSVSQDTSEKFQNSQFLQLMRRIRDREVEVQDNDLREKSSGMPTSELVSERPQPLEPSEETRQTHTATNHFEFPDMDTVYEPTNSDATWSDIEDPVLYGPQSFQRADGTVRQVQSPYTTYGFDDDQYPHSQIEALHPGGKYYPDQSPRLPRTDMEMSGAVPVPSIPSAESVVEDGARLERRISASDFEYVDESAGLARRFVRNERLNS